MTEAEIRKYDPYDEELKAMFGAKFHEGEFPDNGKPPVDNSAREGAFLNPRDRAVTAECTEIPDDAADAVLNICSGNSIEVNLRNIGFFQMLGMFIKPVILFGGMAMLVFYWQNANLMDISVAIPTMCAFTAVMGYGIGKVVGKR